MLAGLCNCCQPTYRCGHACTPTKSHRHTHTQLFDFLQLNINMLITSSFNPSLKIPLKKSVALLLLPPSLLHRSHTSWLHLYLDDSQAERDDTEDSARNIKHASLSKCWWKF